MIGAHGFASIGGQDRFVDFAPGRTRPLPHRLRRALEALSGFDMSDVRVHFGSALPAWVDAQAFAYGTDIHLRPGAEDALAHEAWHVVQQMQGRVTPVRQRNGIAVNDDPALETEADRMGAVAERLCASDAVQQSTRATVCGARIVRPVMQRYVVVGDSGIPLDLRQTRGQLSVFGVTPMTTPHMNVIVNDIVGDDKTFRNYPDWETVRLEVKRRSFGIRHAAAMEALRQAQQAPLNTYLLANNNDPEVVQRKLERLRGATTRNLGTLETRLGAPGFIYWTVNSSPNRAQAMRMIRQGDFYRWYTGVINNPLRMNCWECVLYSGGWTAGGARVPLYTQGYALWALMDRDIPTVGGVIGGGTEQVPSYVHHVVNNPALVAPKNSSTGWVDIPTRLPPGMIVSFSNGQHVALTTGGMRANENPAAREAYGDQGHEILELDGKTYWMVRGTIEDDVAVGYKHDIHFGWLPEIATPTAITLRTPTGTQLYQVAVPQTAFYA